jgi:hypothetical protein
MTDGASLVLCHCASVGEAKDQLQRLRMRKTIDLRLLNLSTNVNEQAAKTLKEPVKKAVITTKVRKPV